MLFDIFRILYLISLITTEQPLAGTGVSIRIDEPADLRIIITAGYIIESGLGWTITHTRKVCSPRVCAFQMVTDWKKYLFLGITIVLINCFTLTTLQPSITQIRMLFHQKHVSFSYGWEDDLQSQSPADNYNERNQSILFHTTPLSFIPYPQSYPFMN